MRSENGQTMAEYAVVLAVITVAILFTLGMLSGKIPDGLGFESADSESPTPERRVKQVKVHRVYSDETTACYQWGSDRSTLECVPRG
jgi:Flp pilus assembly pilin Flp